MRKNNIIMIFGIIIILIIISMVCVFGIYPNACFEYKITGQDVIVENYKCNFIKNVKIPKSFKGKIVNKISDYAFYDDGIKSVKLPNTIEYIGYASFANNKLTNINVPQKIKVINDYAFYSNQLKGSLIIEGSDKDIELGDWVFANNKLDRVTLIYGFKLGKGIFVFNNIKDINLNSETIEEIGEYDFAYNKLNEVDLYVQTSIGDNAFAFNNISTIRHLPTYLEKIGSNAFAYNNIKLIEIPSSVKYIGDNAFYKNHLSNDELYKITYDKRDNYDWSIIVNSNSHYDDVKDYVKTDYGIVEIVSK